MEIFLFQQDPFLLRDVFMLLSVKYFLVIMEYQLILFYKKTFLVVVTHQFILL